jgi:transcriptional regulator with XRE-family HTH domain
MPYHPKTVEALKKLSTKHLGVRLARWAVFHDISAAQISAATGASRQSVYNWMRGGAVFVAYQPAVNALIEIMQGAKSPEEAWSTICTEFNLNP